MTKTKENSASSQVPNEVEVDMSSFNNVEETITDLTYSSQGRAELFLFVFFVHWLLFNKGQFRPIEDLAQIADRYGVLDDVIDWAAEAKCDNKVIYRTNLLRELFRQRQGHLHMLDIFGHVILVSLDDGDDDGQFWALAVSPSYVTAQNKLNLILPWNE